MSRADIQCPECSKWASANERFCPDCRHDLGFPNVRQSGSEIERLALSAGCDSLRGRILAKAYQADVNAFRKAIRDKSSVVITMPANVVRMLTHDPRQVYANYEALVGSGLRRPASEENDRHRTAVMGLLFGSYGTEIRYGNLALRNEGLPTYGDVACRLRPDAVRRRTSFLRNNSFAVAAKMKPGDPVPPGVRSVWENRDELALSKVGTELRPNQGESEWAKMIVVAATGRRDDEFIEAHIFGSFTVSAVEQMEPLGKARDRATRLDMSIALEEFQKLRANV